MGGAKWIIKCEILASRRQQYIVHLYVIYLAGEVDRIPRVGLRPSSYVEGNLEHLNHPGFQLLVTGSIPGLVTESELTNRVKTDLTWVHCGRGFRSHNMRFSWNYVVISLCINLAAKAVEMNLKDCVVCV